VPAGVRCWASGFSVEPGMVVGAIQAVMVKLPVSRSAALSGTVT
jgi:hypothetical protein